MALWGEMAFFLGILSLFLNHWVAPITETSPALMDTLASKGGHYKVPSFLAWTSVTIGGLLTWISVIRLMERR
jgi:hypothetical protein